MGHVARIKRPHLSNDVTRDPYYCLAIKKTKSELAIPILVRNCNDQDDLLGVLNLESNESNTFTSPQMGELVAAAGELAPHILVLNALWQNEDRFGWHFKEHGWTPQGWVWSAQAFELGRVDD